MSDTKLGIIEIITDVNPQVHVAEGETDQSLFDLGLDSLDHATILLLIEERFGCKVADDDIEKITTVDAIVEYVEAATP